MNWSEVLTLEKLQRYAGDRSYTAGVAYAREGAVTGLMVSEYTLTALVQGTEIYEVELEIDSDGDLIGDCSCPYGAEGNFCKHCVAVGIAWLEDVSSASGATVPAQQAFQEYLEKQDKATLIALLLEQIHKDTHLQNHLLLKIAQASPNAPDIKAFQKTIRRAFAVSGYLEYAEVYDYVRGVETVIQSLQALQESGFAQETRQLTEYALEELGEEIQSVDDSSGSVGGILSELHELHLQATLQAPPPVQELVEWLLKVELENEWDIDTGWQDYLPVLGEAGQQRFQEAIRTRWEALPLLTPSGNPSHSGNRYALTSLMIAFAKEKDDKQAIIAIKKRDLSTEYKFLEIAQLYHEVGEPDAALEWAEKGRAAFPDQINGRLLDFLVEEYTRRERYEEAYAILWQRFVERPMLVAYQSLHDYAQVRGEWEVWRTRCWEHLRATRKQKANTKTVGSAFSSYLTHHSEEVRILLWEERNDEAWQEANDGDCSRDLWLALAATRETSHPEDALRLYRAEAEKSVQETTGDYSQALRHLLKVREIMLRTGQDVPFRLYVQRLRAEYKRKRNFIQLLNDNRFPA